MLEQHTFVSYCRDDDFPVLLQLDDGAASFSLKLEEGVLFGLEAIGVSGRRTLRRSLFVQLEQFEQS